MIELKLECYSCGFERIIGEREFIEDIQQCPSCGSDNIEIIPTEEEPQERLIDPAERERIVHRRMTDMPNDAKGSKIILRKSKRVYACICLATLYIFQSVLYLIVVPIDDCYYNKPCSPEEILIEKSVILIFGIISIIAILGAIILITRKKRGWQGLWCRRCKNFVDKVNNRCSVCGSKKLGWKGIPKKEVQERNFEDEVEDKDKPRTTSYRGIGQSFIGLGGFFIIFIMIYTFNYINILGQCCLIIGLSGIYFSKTKNFRSVRKSEEKEGIEQMYSNGINGKALSLKYVYVFYIITIVGVAFSFYYLFLLFASILQGDSIFISIMLPYPVMLLVGDLLLIGGLFLLYFEKNKAP